MSERVLRSPIGCGERGWVGDNNNNTHTYRVDTEIERKKSTHTHSGYRDREKKKHTRILREKIEKDDERKSEEIDLLTVITEVDDGFCF